MKQLGSFVERDLEGSTHWNGAMNCVRKYNVEKLMFVAYHGT